jgi:hypothetical protein
MTNGASNIALEAIDIEAEFCRKALSARQLQSSAFSSVIGDDGSIRLPSSEFTQA